MKNIIRKSNENYFHWCCSFVFSNLKCGPFGNCAAKPRDQPRQTQTLAGLHIIMTIISSHLRLEGNLLLLPF